MRAAGYRPSGRRGSLGRSAPWSGPRDSRANDALTLLTPRTLDEALRLRAAHPEAVVVAGGTGVLLALNAGLEPPALLDLSRVAGLREVDDDGATVRVGAGVTYTTVLERLAPRLPGLAAAARTVASRQIRNRATLAGALVLADPSADVLAPLGALGAEVELAQTAGTRRVPAAEFVRAPGESALGPDELVVALHVPVPPGAEAYAKAGARNAMARAVCGVAVALDGPAATVCVVGMGPRAVVVRGADEELPAQAAAATDPIPDARGSAAYRRHLAEVLTRRALARARAAA